MRASAAHGSREVCRACAASVYLIRPTPEEGVRWLSGARKFGWDSIYGRELGGSEELMSRMQADTARDVPVSAGRSRAGAGASDSEDVEDSDEEQARALACRPTFFHGRLGRGRLLAPAACATGNGHERASGLMFGMHSVYLVGSASTGEIT